MSTLKPEQDYLVINNLNPSQYGAVIKGRDVDVLDRLRDESIRLLDMDSLQLIDVHREYPDFPNHFVFNVNVGKAFSDMLYVLSLMPVQELVSVPFDALHLYVLARVKGI